MNIHVHQSPEALGKAAAAHAAATLNRCVERNGEARLLLSTGASQFDTLSALVRERVDWSRVEMFHLDEYVGLPETHPASFRKYLRERFTCRVPLKAVHFVEGEGDIREVLARLNGLIREKPVDLGLIGIGENAHIAFNDPPADFETEDAYIIVTLDEACKRQQVREGWFPSVGEVPKQAVSMSVRQILRCREIISCVPYAVKAAAIGRTLRNPPTPDIPATILKTHAAFSLYLDGDSAAGMAPSEIAHAPG